VRAEDRGTPPQQDTTTVGFYEALANCVYTSTILIAGQYYCG